MLAMPYRTGLHPERIHVQVVRPKAMVTLFHRRALLVLRDRTGAAVPSPFSESAVWLVLAASTADQKPHRPQAMHLLSPAVLGEVPPTIEERTAGEHRRAFSQAHLVFLIRSMRQQFALPSRRALASGEIRQQETGI
mmetsp:Transcript_85407/g.134853  ORF Transcript_85407/g.134853 Transcript_85407/m.134853 type:complete len:137 (+) Transcript_85407:636-1046(+)